MIGVACWVVGFGCLFLVLLTSSAELCAGSLGSRFFCLFSEQKFAVLFDDQNWEAWCLHFVFWGTILGARGHPRRLGAERRACGPRDSKFDRVWDDLGPHFDRFWAPRVQILFVLSGASSHHFCISFAVEMGMIGSPETRFSNGRPCKNQLFTGIEFW